MIRFAKYLFPPCHLTGGRRVIAQPQLDKNGLPTLHCTRALRFFQAFKFLQENGLRELSGLDANHFLDYDTRYGIVVRMAKKISCSFDVPTHYNNGQPVEPEVFIEIKKVLDKQFNGYKIHGPYEGAWFGQVEMSLTVEVRVFRKDVRRLRKVVVAIGKRLGQKQMDLNIPPPSVESIDIEEEEDEEEDEGESEEEEEKEEDNE